MKKTYLSPKMKFTLMTNDAMLASINDELTFDVNDLIGGNGICE